MNLIMGPPPSHTCEREGPAPSSREGDGAAARLGDSQWGPEGAFASYHNASKRSRFITFVHASTKSSTNSSSASLAP